MGINVAWGGGSSDLFLYLKDGKPEILDYEYDTVPLHEMCGGKNYYCSRSGSSGAGFFTKLGSLLRLGTYRVDTAHNEFQSFLPIGKIREDYEEVELQVAVPYVSHREDKTEILRRHPTVVKFGKTVVYCDFDRNFIDIIKAVLVGKELPEKCEIGSCTYSGRGHRTLKKTFSKLDCYGRLHEEEVVMEFYNLCSMKDTPTPWEFFGEELKEFIAECSQERLYHLMGVERLENGCFVQTIRFDTTKYRGRKLEGNPLETGNLTAGWQRVADDVLVRFYDRSDEAHLVAYAPAQEAYEKRARRLAKKMNETEGFISFVSSYRVGDYAEYEIMIPKVLFLLDEATQVAEVCKGLARKIHEDVTSRARQWINNVNDQVILEAIPDDMIITFDDSLDAGNCRPGTAAFVAQHFPGKTETTAKELKVYSGNHYVMRIFRHLAASGRFEW